MSAKRSASRLSGAERVAVLCFVLGPEAAGQIFDQLEDAEVRAISRAILSTKEIPGDIAQQVLSQYEKEIRTADGRVVNGPDFLRRAVSHSRDETRREMLTGQIEQGMAFRPLETIAMLEPRMVAGILGHEHPQTIALVLSTQGAEHTARVIEYLPDALKADVVYRMACIEKVSPDILNQIEESLRREIGQVETRDQQQVGGLDKVVDILGRMKGKDQTILEKIALFDSDLADNIKKRMFTFEDLVFLDDRSLYTVLREVSNPELALALKTATEPLREKIFQNMSERAAKAMREELDGMGKKRLSEIETAQQQIVAVALRLEASREIVIPGRGMGDQLV